MTINKRDRFEGCLIGLAVGDAIGTSVEFQRPGTFEPITDMIGGGVFRLEPGQWTDDTSMALCLADSLIAKEDFDPDDQMLRYLRWYRAGENSSTGRCFDIGGTVSKALHHFEATSEPYAGAQVCASDNQAGNGSLMRLAPIPMFYAAMPSDAIAAAEAMSQTTHGATTCIDACKYFTGLIIAALRGYTKEEILSPFFTVPDASGPLASQARWEDLHPQIAEVAGGSFKTKAPPEIVGSGFVVKALEAALWAFYHANSFTDGVLLATNLGNDADTTAAIYGQLAGAYYGVNGIPKQWRDKLHTGEAIRDRARALMALSETDVS